jgi:hypothetical protein
MSEEDAKPSIRDRVRWWLYTKCFAYCIRCVHPDADPSEFSLLDNANFIAVSKDEAREIVEESPDSAWRFERVLQ